MAVPKANLDQMAQSVTILQEQGKMVGADLAQLLWNIRQCYFNIDMISYMDEIETLQALEGQVRKVAEEQSILSFPVTLSAGTSLDAEDIFGWYEKVTELQPAVEAESGLGALPESRTFLNQSPPLSDSADSPADTSDKQQQDPDNRSRPSGPK